MGHDMLRLDHNVVSRLHHLALRKTHRMPLDNLLDVGLRDARVGGQVPPQGTNRGATSAEGEHACEREEGELTVRSWGRKGAHVRAFCRE